mmetsp:Transcript_28052/g.42988  ORF Transcript_28052/g.42988 Transcript_28052/m.42988 type:complete len:86 (-) Transcript_28052:196-453(-)
MGDNSTANALVASTDMNERILEMLKEMMASKTSSARASRDDDDTEEGELLKNTWHGKLAMSKSEVSQLLQFYGLKEGQERLIPEI